MKLVDILARDLKEWPEGQKIAEQSKVDNEIYFEPKEFGDFYAPERADDYMDALVTRSQWQEARDALLKADAKEWNGEGLPPVGTVCEYCHPGDDFDKCFIEAYVKDKVVFTCPDYKEDPQAVFITEANSITFRPILTPEQIAADARNAGVRELVKVLSPYVGACLTITQSAEALYDAGYRKQEAK